MTFQGKVRQRVKSFFNPVSFEPVAFRDTARSAVLGMVFAEVTVYYMLKESARLGELPSYITDALIISISFAEFLLAPLIAWLGTQRRRSIMVGWVAVALACMLPAFGAPKPGVEADTALCNDRRSFPAGISPMAAIRLSILTLVGLSCALARVAVTTHALAYLDEFNPSQNLLMNVAVFILVRVVPLLVGTTMLRPLLANFPWLQLLIITVGLIFTIIKLQRYPIVAPAMDVPHGDERGFFRSVGRVLGTKMAVIQILAMSFLAAALWGFGSQEADFAKYKYHVVPGTGSIWEMGEPLRALFIILGVILVGFMYTGPVMLTLDKKAVIRNTARMTNYCVIAFALMTASIDCSKGDVAGLDDTTYIQPFCGLGCGCDRPWTQFDPVCVTEQMTTYYSPCHAGCTSTGTLGNLAMYTNCTCSPSGRVAAGACGDGTCYVAYGLHTTLFTGATLAAALAFSMQLTIMLEAVDRRDKAVALGIASAAVSLFAFVGAHGLYAGIAAYTCALFRGQDCLIQTSKFLPRIGFTSTGLAGASLLITAVAYIIQHRQTKREDMKKKQAEAEQVNLSRL